MLWFKRRPIARGPTPEGPWPGTEVPLPGYVVTGRRQSHSAHPGTFRGLRGHSHDFQGVKFRRLQVRQDLLDCSPEHLLLVNTKDGRSELTSPTEEGPSRFSDFSIQSAPTEILD